ncbi:unnamed protein product, partial [Meganyctiphanes norvegica]
GPKKYRFWGSNDNGDALEDSSTWTILSEDLSGDSFNKENTPKTFEVENPQPFLAYGFEVLETNNPYVTMSNIHFFTVEPIKELVSPSEEVESATQALIDLMPLLVSVGDPYTTIDQIRPHLAVLLQMANLEQQQSQVAQ